jgi:hypothetical protein
MAAKKKSPRAKTSRKKSAQTSGKKKTTVKDLAPKKSTRGGVTTQTGQVANPALSGNTIGGSLGFDSLRGG